MFQYWVEQSYDRISFLYLFIGRRFCVRWRNWGNAHPREVVPGQPRLLSELPQHHAHTRRGCRLLHASGEASRLVSHTSGSTFYCSAAFNQCKQKPQLNITDPIFRRFLATKKFVVETRSEKFSARRVLLVYWSDDWTEFQLCSSPHTLPPSRLRQSFARKMCKRAVTFLSAKYFNNVRKTLENAKV